MKIKSHSDVIDLWDCIDDLSREIGIKYTTIYQWHRIGRIPIEHWKTFIRLTKKKGVVITGQTLFDTYR